MEDHKGGRGPMDDTKPMTLWAFVSLVCGILGWCGRVASRLLLSLHHFSDTMGATLTPWEKEKLNYRECEEDGGAIVSRFFQIVIVCFKGCEVKLPVTTSRLPEAKTSPTTQLT